MKRSLPPRREFKGLKGSVRSRVATLAASLVLGSCSQTSPQLQDGARSFDHTKSALVAVGFESFNLMGDPKFCPTAALKFRRADATGQPVTTEKFRTFVLGVKIEPAAQQLIVEPGSYELESIYCSAHDKLANFVRPERRAMARFSASAGEVVDIGKIYFIDAVEFMSTVNVSQLDSLKNGTLKFIDVMPNPPEELGDLKIKHPTLTTRLAESLMPMSSRQKQEVCEGQTTRRKQLGKKEESALCKLLASDAPARQNKASRNGTIQ